MWISVAWSTCWVGPAFAICTITLAMQPCFLTVTCSSLSYPSSWNTEMKGSDCMPIALPFACVPAPESYQVASTSIPTSVSKGASRLLPSHTHIQLYMVTGSWGEQTMAGEFFMPNFLLSGKTRTCGKLIAKATMRMVFFVLHRFVCLFECLK